MRPTDAIETNLGALRHDSIQRRAALTCVVLFLSTIAAASADTYTVGSGGCSDSTIASALTAAENHPGPDTIRITRSGTYSQQAINFTTSQELTLTGGYADCTTATEDNVQTTLSGSGGAAASVLMIGGGAGSNIHIRKLTITGGDSLYPAFTGGGITYSGKGILDIADTQISNNRGPFGGGILAIGTDDASEVYIGPNVTISQNIGDGSGGGVFLQDINAVIRGDDSIIFNNHALGSHGDGYGGGIYIAACARASTVFLSSGNVLGVVSANDATHGGGVAIRYGYGCSDETSASGPADLRIFSTSSSMTKITGNSASVSGGGIYAFGADGEVDVHVWNAAIDANDAPDGAAMDLNSVGNSGSAGVDFNPPDYFLPPRPDGALDCTVGVPCGYLRGNIASTGTVIAGYDSYLSLRKVAVSGNKGSELSNIRILTVSDSLISDNTSTNRLIASKWAEFSDSTIAGNHVGGSEVFGMDYDSSFSLSRSVLWQPGKLIVPNLDGVISAFQVVVNESASLGSQGQHPDVLVADPRFIDPAHGDFRPTAGSPLIDYSYGYAAFKDLLSQPRAINLALVEDNYGSGDIGAYERQAIAPLVENSDFYSNAYVWVIPNGAAASFDASQNAPGSTGGSLHIKYSTTADTAVGAVQCIHLPGPGDYSLNGSGKVASGGNGPDSHSAFLYWELRLSGTESCSGTPDATGAKAVGSTGSGWSRSPNPTHIVVTPQQFTTDTSIAVYLKMSGPAGNGRPNGISAPSAATLKEGWIDRVVLSVDDPDDHIFDDGFES